MVTIESATRSTVVPLVDSDLPMVVVWDNKSSELLLGAICGSARSMDRAAQSMDP